MDGEGRPELSFGRMMSPLNEYRQKHRDAAWIARETMRDGVPVTDGSVPGVPRRGTAEEIRVKPGARGGWAPEGLATRPATIAPTESR